MRPGAGRDAPELEQRVRRALRRAEHVLRRTAGGAWGAPGRRSGRRRGRVPLARNRSDDEAHSESDVDDHQNDREETLVYKTDMMLPVTFGRLRSEKVYRYSKL
jgi:hypothetical protein